MKSIAILGSLTEPAVIKLVLVPKGQSLDFDAGDATRRWLHPHLEGGWHLIEFVPLEKFRKLSWYTVQRIDPES